MMAGIARGAGRAGASATSRPPSRTSAWPHGFGIVRPFVGHGIGTEMHQEPQVPNYRTGSRGAELQPGICLAIEPMFTLGSGDVVRRGRRLDRRHADGALAAHFEHTIAITDDGPEILTTIQ